MSVKGRELEGDGWLENDRLPRYINGAKEGEGKKEGKEKQKLFFFRSFRRLHPQLWGSS